MAGCTGADSAGRRVTRLSRSRKETLGDSADQTGGPEGSFRVCYFRFDVCVLPGISSAGINDGVWTAGRTDQNEL